MSGIQINKLRAVFDEFNAANEALGYIDRFWTTADVMDALGSAKLRHIRSARQNLERTYLVRLTAEFERVLRDHLAAAHSGQSEQ